MLRITNGRMKTKKKKSTQDDPNKRGWIFVVVKQLLTTIYCILPPYQINGTAIFPFYWSTFPFYCITVDGYSFKYN